MDNIHAHPSAPASKASRALLHHSAPSGGDEYELAESILMGADPNAQDAQGARPIHLATEPAKVFKLSAAGSDLDAVCPKKLRDGNRRDLRAIDMALRDEDGARLRALLDCGASLSLAGQADNDLGLTPAMAAAAYGDPHLLRSATPTPREANAADRLGRAPLYFSLLFPRELPTQILLDRGADPLSTDMFEQPSAHRPKNALFRSACRPSLASHFEAMLLSCRDRLSPEIARELLLAAIHVEGRAVGLLRAHCSHLLSTEPEDYRGNPAHLAIADDNPSGLRELLAMGFDPNGSREGIAYIESAAADGNAELCDILLGAGAVPTRESVRLASAEYFRSTRGSGPDDGPLARRLESIANALEERRALALSTETAASPSNLPAKQRL